MMYCIDVLYRGQKGRLKSYWIGFECVDHVPGLFREIPAKQKQVNNETDKKKHQEGKYLCVMG